MRAVLPIAAATSHLAKLGVLVLRADAVEGLATIDRVMLDKTGTLTSGEIAAGIILVLSIAVVATFTVMYYMSKDEKRSKQNAEQLSLSDRARTAARQAEYTPQDNFMLNGKEWSALEIQQELKDWERSQFDEEVPDFGVDSSTVENDPSQLSKKEIQALIDAALDAGDYAEVGKLAKYLD